MNRLSILSSKRFFVCFTNSIRFCSLYVSVARLQQDPVEHFFQKGKHPPNIFILETEEPGKIAAQQNGEQVSESHVCNWG